MVRLALVASFFLLAGPAHAGKIGKSARQAETDRLKRGAERVAKDCGCQVEATVDFASFPDETMLLGAGSLADDFADAAQRQCQGKASKKAFCEGVKKFVVASDACRSDGAPPPPQLVKGTLRVSRCSVAGGVSSDAIWKLFDTELDTPDKPIGDTTDGADPEVKTTPEQAVGPGSLMYPPDATPSEKESIFTYWQGVAEAADRVVKECGHRPSAVVDWPSFKPGGHYGNAGFMCSCAMLAVAAACQPTSGGIKQAELASIVRDKVKSVRCHEDPKIKPDQNDLLRARYALKDGVFDVWSRVLSDGTMDCAFAAQWLRDGVQGGQKPK